MKSYLNKAITAALLGVAALIFTFAIVLLLFCFAAWSVDAFVSPVPLTIARIISGVVGLCTFLLALISTDLDTKPEKKENTDEN